MRQQQVSVSQSNSQKEFKQPQIQHISTNDIPSFGVDIQFETLKKYLDDISGALNQHAIKINDLEKDLGKKVETTKLADTINMIGEGLGYFDNEFGRITKQMMGQGRAENSQSALDNSQNKMINREVQISHGLSYLYSRNKKIEPNLENLETMINDKVNTSIWKEKKKKHKRMFQKEFEDQRSLTDQKFRELDKRLSDQIRIIQEKAEDIEKKTLWRIAEMESQLRSKINKVYVDDSCRAVEEKLKREFAKNIQDAAGNIQMYNELKSQLKYVDDSLNDKVKQQKRQLNELEETLEKKYVAKISHDERSKFITEKFVEFSTRFKELEKKSELASIIDKQSNKIKTIEDKMVEFENELTRKFADIMLHQQKEEYKKQQEESVHKICTLEGLVKNLQNDLNKSKQSKLDLDADLVKRVESIETDIKNSPFGMQKKNLEGQLQKLTIEDLATQKELSNHIDLLKIEVEEKLQETIDKVYIDLRKMNSEERGSKVNATINEIFRRVDQIEQKITKSSRDMDTTSLFKQLRDKAETDQVKRDFMVQDTKISQINENINNIRKELENMGKMYSKMLTSMRDGTLQTVEEQLVVMSKRLLPANCISCNVLPGKMNEKSRKQAATLKTAQRNDGYVLGSDKKPYKIDINYLAQQQQQLTDQLTQQADSLKQVVGQNFMYQAQLSSIPSDQDVLSLGVGQQGYVYLDKSQISNTMPVLKKGTRPSTAKVVRSESKVKKLRPESAKEP